MTTSTAPRTPAARVFDSHFVATSTRIQSYATSPETADSWAIQDIKNGIAEADARDFASPEEVRRVFAKYGC
jgi:predicted transcriptional regulator